MIGKLAVAFAAPFVAACAAADAGGGQRDSEPSCRPQTSPPPIPTSAPPNSSYTNSGMPPTRYQGNTSVTIEFASPDEVNRRCAGGVPVCGFRFYACRRGDKLIMPNPCPSGQAYSSLLCHEIAHMNGWPATHGD